MKRSIKPYFIYFICILAAVGLAVGYEQWHTQQPKPDFSNLPAYISAVELSHDSKMMAIKREIAAGPAKVAHEKTLALAAGISFSLPNLQSSMTPVNENAAPIYQHIYKMHKNSPMKLPDYAQPLVFGYAYSPQELDTVRQTLARHSHRTSLTLLAAAKPYCVFPYKWCNCGAIPLLEFPYLVTLRGCSHTLNTESYLLAWQHRYAKAIHNESLGYNVVKQAASGPGLIHLLVGIAIDAETAQGMVNILYLSGPNVAVDMQVQKAVLSASPHFDLKATMLREAANELMMTHAIKGDPKMVNNYLGLSFRKPKSLTPQQAIFTRKMIDAAEARYLQQIRMMLPVADESEPARSATLAQIAPSQNISGFTFKPTLDPVQYIMNNSMITDYAPVAHKIDSAESEDQIVAAAASVLAVKANTGSFPKTLPGRFIDPFGGKELGYRQEGKNGFVVYSVGKGGDFNGGHAGQYKYSPYGRFFRYPAPPLKPVSAYF